MLATETLAVAANLLEAMRFFGRARSTGEVRDMSGMCLVVSGLNYAAFNAALLAEPIDSDGNELSHRVQLSAAHFDSRQLRWTYWMHFAEGSLMPQLLLDLVLASALSRAPEALREAAKAVSDGARHGYVAPNLETLFDFVEAELAKSPWFAGEEFSAADVMMSFPLEAAVARARAGEGRPKLAAYVERIHARPAYRKALARGGPYAYAN